MRLPADGGSELDRTQVRSGGVALGALAALWLAGRVALLASHATGPAVAAAIDLLFPVALIAVIARELIAGRNWRNMPILAALGLLLAGNALVHLQAMGIAYTADLGSRLGIATLLALISLVGGRIVPNFTGNWLTRSRPDIAPPASFDRIDAACMAATVAGLAAWTIAPERVLTAWLEILAGTAAAIRLSRWRGLATIREPLLFVLHAGYAWLAFGLAFLGLNGLFAWVPAGAPLHALTVGAIGTMTLAVMTRATLGHTGRPLTAGRGHPGDLRPGHAGSRVPGCRPALRLGHHRAHVARRGGVDRGFHSLPLSIRSDAPATARRLTDRLPAMYLLVKQLHVACVVLSLAGFVARGALMAAGAPLLRSRFVRVAPHVVDTALLASAIWLAWASHQYPFVHGWLTAKVLGLLAYIGFGAMALKHGRTLRARLCVLLPRARCRVLHRRGCAHARSGRAARLVALVMIPRRNCAPSPTGPEATGGGGNFRAAFNGWRRESRAALSTASPPA